MSGDKPAFPLEQKNSDGVTIFDTHPGLSKRELFAAMAAQGMVGSREWLQPEGDSTLGKHIAHQAVALADALLAELSRTRDGEME